MADYRTRDLIAALLKKGFQRDRTHHDIFWYYLDGKKTSVRTRTSKGETQYGASLFALRRKQLGDLSRDQLLLFIECPLTAEQYCAFLLETGRVRPR